LIGSGILVLGVDLEEGLNVLGSLLEVLGLQGHPDAVDAVGAADNGVDAKEGGVDVGLCEVELADLAADMKFIDIEEFVPLSSSDSTMAPINPFRADPISLRSFWRRRREDERVRERRKEMNKKVKEKN
jgi:hypothetical protein